MPEWGDKVRMSVKHICSSDAGVGTYAVQTDWEDSFNGLMRFRAHLSGTHGGEAPVISKRVHGDTFRFSWETLYPHGTRITDTLFVAVKEWN
jgi:hypothetical protein